MHRARAATHWDGPSEERGRDVAIIKEHLRFFEKRENHAMYGADGSYGAFPRRGMKAVSGAGRSVTILSTKSGLAP